ncbi:MAG: hypothetical protein WC812_04640 [Candidatus Pacearchaeota archaeon]|jgi:hypothetical protein
MKKRGQVTIFVIIAIVIIVLGVLAFFLYPKLKISTGFNTENPELFLQNCVENDLENLIETLSLQGGEFNPQGYTIYQDVKIKYICYTSDYFTLGLKQVPFIKRFVEDEISVQIKPKVDECFDDLVLKYQQKGYEVSSKKGNIQTEILPEQTSIDLIGYNLTVSRGENENRFNLFVINLDNNLYELLNIAEHIVSWENEFGDADTLSIMMLKKDIRVNKILRDDGSKIYIIENKKTKEAFQFASRSLVFPAGLF